MKVRNRIMFLFRSSDGEGSCGCYCWVSGLGREKRPGEGILRCSCCVYFLSQHTLNILTVYFWPLPDYTVSESD